MGTVLETNVVAAERSLETTMGVFDLTALREKAPEGRGFAPAPFGAFDAGRGPPIRGPPVEEAALGKDDVYIGRGWSKGGLKRSRWHNPFRIKEHLSRKQAVEQFRSNLRSSACLRRSLAELAGRRLRCHCQRGLACHGDVLIEEFIKAKSKKFDKEVPMFVEVFAGHGGLSEKVKEKGLATCPVDWSRSRHTAKGPFVNVDLTDEVAVESLFEKMSRDNVALVWVAPPSGTFSAIRAVPLPQRVRQEGCPEPRPLRSHEFPLGLSGLSEIDDRKVARGNALARVAAKLAAWAIEHGLPFCVENPPSSILWSTPWFAELLNEKGVFFVRFQACMFGGSRDKKTALLTNWAPAVRLIKACDKKHQHAAWGTRWSKGRGLHLNKAEDAEYPEGFCDTFAALLAEDAKHAGWHLHPRGSRTTKVKPEALSLAERAAAAGKQTNKYPSKLVPEYKDVFSVADVPKEVLTMARLQWNTSGLNIGNRLFEPGSLRLLEVPREQGVEVQGGPVWKFGVPWSEEEFTDMACKVKHPMDGPPVLPSDVVKAAAWMASSSKRQVAEHFERVLQKWRARAGELQEEEARLHAHLPDHRAKVLEGKRLRVLG